MPDTHTSAGSGHAATSGGSHLNLLAVEQELAGNRPPDALQCIFDVSTLHCDVQ